MLSDKDATFLKSFKKILESDSGKCVDLPIKKTDNTANNNERTQKISILALNVVNTRLMQENNLTENMQGI